jgi:hypothetical protein
MHEDRKEVRRGEVLQNLEQISVARQQLELYQVDHELDIQAGIARNYAPVIVAARARERSLEIVDQMLESGMSVAREAGMLTFRVGAPRNYVAAVAERLEDPLEVVHVALARYRFPTAVFSAPEAIADVGAYVRQHPEAAPLFVERVLNSLNASYCVDALPYIESPEQQRRLVGSILSSGIREFLVLAEERVSTPELRQALLRARQLAG